MIVAESHRSRRLIGRLDRGADLLPALAELCTARGVRCAEIRAFGALEEVELREWDQKMRAWRPVRRFTTPLSLVQLSGNLTALEGRAHLEAQVTLSRERDNGIELIGGQLVRARVHAVDFVVDALDDVLLRRALDAATGMWLITEAYQAPAAAGPAPSSAAAPPSPALATAPPASTPEEPDEAPAHTPFEAPARGFVSATREAGPRSSEPLPSWAEVAAASAAVADIAEEEPLSEDPLRPGDVIEHPRFGLCEVERIEGDSEFAQVRLRNQRLVRLSLDVLQVVRAGSEPDGRRRFRAVLPR